MLVVGVLLEGVEERNLGLLVLAQGLIRVVTLLVVPFDIIINISSPPSGCVVLVINPVGVVDEERSLRVL